MANDLIIFYGISKLCEQLEKKEISLSHTVEILNDALAKLDPNGEKYVEKMKAINTEIRALKNSENSSDWDAIKKRMYTIQQIFDLSSLSN
jgi:hypothetical protein